MESKRKQIDLTTGSITRSIFVLAWPAVGTMFLQTAFSIADAFWVGKLGAVSMAAVISSTFMIWIIFSLSSVISTGVVAMVSRFIGAKDKASASYVSGQAIFFSILSSLALSSVGILTAKQVFLLMGTEPGVTQLGVVYLRITYAGTIFFFLIDTIGALFRASGDTKTPLRVAMLSISLNIILDPILIFGWLGFPELGTAGAAIATFISQGLGTLLYFILLKRRSLLFEVKIQPKLDFSTIFRLIKIGIPTSISGILFCVVYLFINKITALFGTEAIAALGIGNRMESVSYLTCFGLSIAASTLVGQNLGAKKPQRSEEAAWSTVRIAVFVTGFISLMFLLFPRHIASFPIAVNINCHAARHKTAII